MNNHTGPKTTVPAVVRVGAALLTAGGCAAVMVNALILQPESPDSLATDAIAMVLAAQQPSHPAELLTQVRVIPEDAIAKLVTEGDPLVRQIQTELRRLGHYTGDPDGVAGARTRTAILAYERASGLVQTGEPSERVLEHINLSKRVSEAAVYANDAEPQSPSLDVMKVQKALLALGFDAGSADGVMGEKTRQAIRAFQSYRGLGATGRIDAALGRELGIVLAADG